MIEKTANINQTNINTTKTFIISNNDYVKAALTLTTHFILYNNFNGLKYRNV